MKKYLSSSIGRLRLISFVEGVTLLMLLLITMPLKYIFNIPQPTRIIGSIHGAFFVLFVIYVINVGTEYNWNLKTFGKVLLSCFIPFGTFYVDSKILKPLHQD